MLSNISGPTDAVFKNSVFKKASQIKYIFDMDFTY